MYLELNLVITDRDSSYNLKDYKFAFTVLKIRSLLVILLLDEHTNKIRTRDQLSTQATDELIICPVIRRFSFRYNYQQEVPDTAFKNLFQTDQEKDHFNLQLHSVLSNEEH